MEQIYRLTGRPLRAVFDWPSKYKQFFDPAGHAWSFVEVADKTAEPEATTRRGHGSDGRQEDLLAPKVNAERVQLAPVPQP